MRPGRHGGMSSSEFESLLVRNGNFLVVHRAGDGDGEAGLYNSVTNEFQCGIGGGWLPEYSFMRERKYDCECTPNGLCRTGNHGTRLIRGWRNILYELLARKRVRATVEIKRTLGGHSAQQAYDYGQVTAPMFNPAPSWEYSSLG